MDIVGTVQVFWSIQGVNVVVDQRFTSVVRTHFSDDYQKGGSRCLECNLGIHLTKVSQPEIDRKNARCVRACNDSDRVMLHKRKWFISPLHAINHVAAEPLFPYFRNSQ